MKKQATQISLEKEVTLLRSFVIGTAGKDKEGNYNPKFLESLERSEKDYRQGRYRKINSLNKLYPK